MEKLIEFAEEYSKKEKIRIIILIILFAILATIVGEKWLFPCISWYVNTVQCHSLFGLSGILVLLYSLFAGLPLLCAFLMGILLLPLGVKGIKQGQYPPKGSKVLKPTKIIKGRKAKVLALICIIIPLSFVLMAAWGFLQIEKMPSITDHKVDYSLCKS